MTSPDRDSDTVPSPELAAAMAQAIANLENLQQLLSQPQTHQSELRSSQINDLAQRLSAQTNLLVKQLQSQGLAPASQSQFLDRPLQNVGDDGDAIEDVFESLFADNSPSPSNPRPFTKPRSRKRSFWQSRGVALFGLTVVLLLGVGVWIFQDNLPGLSPQHSPTTIAQTEQTSPPLERSEPVKSLEPKPSQPLDQPTSINQPTPQESNPKPDTNGFDFAEPVEPAPIALSPEQDLIYQVTNQLKSLNQKITNELVADIEVDFSQSLLKIIVNDGWYALTNSDRLNLVNDAYQKGNFLHFQKIQFWDQKQQLLARNPVLGEGMLIIKSQR